MEPLKRLYKMSDGSLAGTAQTLAIAAERDLAMLVQYGWDQNRIDGIKLARNNFSDLPTDLELSGSMTLATAAKNLVRKNATDYCAVQILIRVSQHFGEDSREYRQFDASELYSATDNDYWFALKRVKRLANGLLATLSTEGLLQDHLDTLGDFITEMDEAMEAQKLAIDARNIAVRTRVLAGNAMYQEMTKLAEVGKRIWLNVDDSLYNDYILYPNQGGNGTPAEQQVFESNVATESVLNLSVTGIDGSEIMTGTNTGTVPLTIYFAALPTDLPPVGMGSLAPGTEASGTAAAAGYEVGVKEYLNVYNPSTDTVGSISLTVVG